MADRSHLTPTTIVDRRGRHTTVYRNNSTAPAARPLDPLPAANLPAPAPAQRGLRTPAPLSEQEIETAAARAQALLPAAGRMRETLTGWPEGRVALALASEVIAAGVLTHVEGMQVLGYGVGEGGPSESGAVLALDFIRVAERVAPRFSRRGDYWASDLSEAMMGAREGHKDPIRSDDELDSMAAVAAFALWDRDEERHTTLWNSRFYFGRSIADPALDSLLRERPHDLDRIIAHIAERGMDDVDTLRTALDHSAPTLDSGWL